MPIILTVSPIHSQNAMWQNSSIPSYLKKVCERMYTPTTAHTLRRDDATSFEIVSAVGLLGIFCFLERKVRSSANPCRMKMMAVYERNKKIMKETLSSSSPS